MSKGLNQVQLIGNLGADPECRVTTSGVAVANINVASTETWKKGDEKVEHTEWHRITLWAGLADVARQYLHKGNQVFIQGKLRTRKWEDQSGVERWSTEIHATDLVMLGQASGNGERPPAPTAADGREIDDEIPY